MQIMGKLIGHLRSVCINDRKHSFKSSPCRWSLRFCNELELSTCGVTKNWEAKKSVTQI